MKLFFDTSVLVAAGVLGHPQHAAGLAAYRQVMSGRHSGVVSAHGLAEAYSVLTRLPVTPMIQPTEAYRYLTESVVPHCETVSLGELDYLALLESVAKAGSRGGIVYDAIQLQCAVKAACDRIYTFNLKDFIRIAPQLQNKIMSP
ncbi:MAG: VapC toxin family PIN domain ribonuclease [Acidobacteria bacterium]|nr:MAG: VapC toxin family PIN domain ribonuclease [Acidobacteriota bacterium]